MIFRNRKKYLVLGHARSGTGYMSKLFQSQGYDVGHEKVGKHGISSWMFATYEKPWWTFDYKDRTQYRFDTTIQIIREPISAIASVAYTESASLLFRSKYVLIHGNLLERAVMSYIGWNKLILAQKPDYIWQLENAHVKLGNMLNRKVKKLEPKNKREHAELTLDQIRTEINPSLYEQFELFLGFYYNLNVE